MVSCTEAAVFGFFNKCSVLCVDFQNRLPDFHPEWSRRRPNQAGAVFSMTRIFFLILCLGFVAACDGGGGDVLQAPTTDGTDGDTDGDGTTDETPISSDRGTPDLPPAQPIRPPIHRSSAAKSRTRKPAAGTPQTSVI